MYLKGKRLGLLLATGLMICSTLYAVRADQGRRFGSPGLRVSVTLPPGTRILRQDALSEWNSRQFSALLECRLDQADAQKTSNPTVQLGLSFFNHLTWSEAHRWEKWSHMDKAPIQPISTTSGRRGTVYEGRLSGSPGKQPSHYWCLVLPVSTKQEIYQGLRIDVTEPHKNKVMLTVMRILKSMKVRRGD